MGTQQGPIFPFGEPIAASDSLLVTPRWRRWLLLLREAVDLSQIAIPVPAQLAQTGSIPTTSMDSGALSAGLYAVSWYLAIVTTAVGRTAQVTIAWIDGGVSKSYTAPSVDGSIALNVQVNQLVTLYSDAAQPISYTVAYGGLPGMTYDFRPVLQAVSQ